MLLNIYTISLQFYHPNVKNPRILVILHLVAAMLNVAYEALALAVNVSMTILVIPTKAVAPNV